MQGADPANRPSFSWFLLPVSHSSTILTNCSAAEFVCRRNRAVLRQHSMHNVLRLHPGIVSWAAAWQQAPRCPPSIATGVRQQAFLMSDRSRPAGAARGGRAALWLPPAEAS